MKKILNLIWLLLPLFSSGQLPDPFPNTYINDYAGVLTKQQTYTLNDSILRIEQRSGVQIAVLLINKLPADVAIEDYALNIGRKWHVGNAENGILYVASIGEHKQRLEVATHMEGDIPDALASNILDGLKPFYREGDYYDGLTNLLQNINTAIDPNIKEQKALQAAALDKTVKDAGSIIIRVLLWLGGISIFIYLIYLGGFKREPTDEETSPTPSPLEHPIYTAGVKKRKYLGSTKKYDNSSQGRVHSVTDELVPILAASTILSNVKNNNEDEEDSNNNASNSSTSDDSSNSDDSSSFGNWGGSGGDSSVGSDSGFSGGGASGDW